MMNNDYSTENILNLIHSTGEKLAKIDSAGISSDNYLGLEEYLKQLQQLKQLFDDRYSIHKQNENKYILLIAYFLHDYILDIFNNIGTDVDKDTRIEIWINLLKNVGNELVLIADSIKSNNKINYSESCSNLIRYYYIALDDKWRESHEEITIRH